MAWERNGKDHVELAMNQLAESVLGISDEDVLAEVADAGFEARVNAERVRTLLADALQALESMELRLWSLGHTINSKSWQSGRGGYRNRCVSCGLAVSLKVATGEIDGSAVRTRCPESRVCEDSQREAYRRS